MKPSNLFVYPVLALLSMSAPLSAIRADEADLPPLPVREVNLKNGLTVLLLERHHSPTVACQIAFKVGSNNERTGVTGSAHMLEHMMFKGTRTIGTKHYESEVPVMAEIDRLANLILDEKLKGDEADTKQIEEWHAGLKAKQEEQRQFIISEEMANIYKKRGGTGMNAYTSDDYTNYIIKLPSNKLELWCWLESDRITSPVFREFYSEKEVVTEERRMRHDDDPGGALWELFMATAYHAHPYRWPTIGWPSDISNYRRETMEEFFARYYAPNNAVVVWVGDFDTDEAISLITKYFQGLPAQEPPPDVTTQEPAQRGERRAVREFDANPSLIIGWHATPLNHPDQPVLEVIEGILSSGRTSRLYTKLREEEQLATDVGAYLMRSEYPGQFLVYADPLKGVSLEKIEETLLAEVDRLREEPVSEWELQRVKNGLQADYVRKLESNYELAKELAEYECKADWTDLSESERRKQHVTAEDVQAVAKKYFNPAQRTTAALKPPENKESM